MGWWSLMAVTVSLSKVFMTGGMEVSVMEVSIPSLT